MSCICLNGDIGEGRICTFDYWRVLAFADAGVRASYLLSTSENTFPAPRSSAASIIPLSSFFCRISSKIAWCIGLGFFPPDVMLFTAGSATLLPFLAAIVHDGAQDSCLFFFGVEPRKSPIKKNWAIKKNGALRACMHRPDCTVTCKRLYPEKKNYYAAPRPGNESSFFGVALSKL